jgi:hypothetical protein
MNTVEHKNPAETPGAEHKAVAAVLVVVALVLAAFLLNFVKSPIASTSDKWGQLGDYFGGLLNPVVALAALYLLSLSIRIQRKELAATRQALDEQARHANDSADLAALTSLVNAALAEAGMHRDHLRFLVQQISAHDQAVRQHDWDVARAGGRGAGSPGGQFAIYSIEGRPIPKVEAIQSIVSVHQRMDRIMRARSEHEQQIREILAKRLA